MKTLPAICPPNIGDRFKKLLLAGVCLLNFWVSEISFSANFTVAMKSGPFRFEPRDLTINVGDTVTWINQDFTRHDTISGSGVPNGIWNSDTVFPQLMANGDMFSFAFSSVPPGNYPYYCRPHLSFGMVGSITVVAANVPPSVAITSPPGGATFAAGTNILIEATAADSDGSVARVDFFANGVPIGTDSDVPYSVTLNNVAAGNYVLTAVATDNQGASSTSAANNISVQASNVPPGMVVITSPTNGAKFPLHADVLVIAEASDTDGTITQVEFFSGTNSIGIATNAPYSVVLSNLPAGIYTLTAQALDDQGGASTSLPLAFTVHNPPSIVLTQPPTNSPPIPLGTTLTLEAAVTTFGTETNAVEFLEGNNSIAKIFSPPFRFNWNPSEARSYVLTAVAMDELGQRATSAPVSIRVFVPEFNRPTLSITGSPPNLARLTNALITLAGVADDNIGLERIEIVATSRFGSVTNVADGTNNWQKSFYLSPGLNTIRVRSIDQAGNTSFEITRFFTYVVTARLTVEPSGSGVVTPDLNGRALEVGQVYTIRARPAAGFIFGGWGDLCTPQSATLSFLMMPGLILKPTFVANSFPVVAGTYTGLFFNPTNETLESSGFFTLSVGHQGAFTGALLMNGARHPLRGQFDCLGQVTFPVLRGLARPAVVSLTLDLTNHTDEVHGRVTGASGDHPINVWSADLLGYRNVFAKSPPAPQAGTHSFNLVNETNTIIGTVTARIATTGNVLFQGGFIGDNCRFRSTATISKNGNVPFYVSLARGTEVIIGWARFPDDASSAPVGTFFWSGVGTNNFRFNLTSQPAAP